MNPITNGATVVRVLHKFFRSARLDVPRGGVEPFPISGLLLRRAVLGTLLSAGGPLSPAEIAAALAAAGATTSPARTKSPSRLIADLLAYQVRIGKVVKVGPALFAAVPERISRSTRQRCVGWRRQFDQRVADVAAWEAEFGQRPDPVAYPSSECVGPPLSDADAPLSPVPATPATHGSGPPLSDALASRVEASERGGLGHTRTLPAAGAETEGSALGNGVSSEGGGLVQTTGTSSRAGGYPAAMFTVELATAEDLDVLVEQGAALFREDAGTYDTFIDFTWSQREGRADFEHLIASDDCLVLVAREGATVIAHLVGYTHSASPTRLPVTYANLRSLYVEPAHRRRGAADQLTLAFIGWARAKGCAEAHVDSYARNEPAQRLYERHGFVVLSTASALTL